jgi:hypothetical protein
VQIIAHSAVTFAIPRSRNWRNPSRLLDLSEHRPDHLFAQAIAAAMAGALEPCAHPGEERAGLGGPTRGGGLGAMLVSSGCDVALIRRRPRVRRLAAEQ